MNWAVVLHFLFLGTILSGSDALDCETTWTSYKDEKCLKVLDNFVTFEEAESLCLAAIGGKKSSYNQEDDDIPPILTIKSAEEQEFASKFIFGDSQILDNVWLSGHRRGNESLDFVWADGSPLEYTNWHEGSPSNIPGSDCMQILPKGVKQNLRDTVDGRWSDVTCLKRNLVVCQKLQTWSLRKLQKISLETTKALIELQNNPVPIGFIYAQLPNQPDAKTTWPNVEWADVTGEYAGTFFRAEGGNSAPFGETQAQEVPRISHVSTHPIEVGSITFSQDVPATQGDSDFHLFTGADVGYYYAIQFHVAGHEVRPQNQAIRIWKRVA